MDQRPNQEEQLDLFNDFSEPRVFTCIFGSYIGVFNRAGENPIDRLSDFMSAQEAEKALEAGHWSPPLPEIE